MIIVRFYFFLSETDASFDDIASSYYKDLLKKELVAELRRSERNVQSTSNFFLSSVHATVQHIQKQLKADLLFEEIEDVSLLISWK